MVVVRIDSVSRSGCRPTPESLDQLGNVGGSNHPDLFGVNPVIDDPFQLFGRIEDVSYPLPIAATHNRRASRRMWSSRSLSPPLETTSTSQPRTRLSSS